MRTRAAAFLLALLLPAFAAAGEGLPEFRLNRLKARALLEPCPGFYIPPVSPPQRISGDLPARFTEFAPPPELYPLYRPYEAGFVPLGHGIMRTRSGSGGPGGTDNVKLTGAVKVSVRAAGGKATVNLPRAEFQDPLPGDEALFFVWFSSAARPAELSWALVLCSAGGYLGYKGATLELPAAGGGFSATESLALGDGKGDLARTHPWLASRLKGRGFDLLCSESFAAKNRDLGLRALPAGGNFRFAYDEKNNALGVAWTGR